MDDGLGGLLGLAQRAGKLQAGEESVSAAAKGHKARLILLASDAAERTRRHAQTLEQTGNAPLLPLPMEKGELGRAIGRGECAIVALTDVGMAAAVVKKLARTDPEGCGEAERRLTYKAEKTLRRRRETQARRKAAGEGRKKPWAAPPKEE